MRNRQSRPSDATGTTIQLRLLGPMQIHVGDGEVGLSARKARALLAYLALRPGAVVPRETLAGLLWGDRGEEQARASLRQTLSAVRRALGKEAAASVIATQDSVTLAGERIWVDVEELERTADTSSADDLMTAAALYRGDLLEGLALNEPAFDQWLTAQRERARLLVCRLLSRLVGLLEQDHRLEEAIAQGARLLALDSLQEDVHRRLMRLYMLQGRYDAALSQFERCRRELAVQLDVEPEQETLDMVAALKARRRRANGEGDVAHEPGPASPRDGETLLPQTSPPSLPDKPSIAVLPFTNMSGDAEQEYFSDGITEDIITELSRFRSLFVVARNSSFAFRGDSVDVREVGRSLGVRFVLEGSVRRAGNRIRITSQVTDASSTENLWSDRYDGDLADVFALQDEISRSIVSTIAGRLEDFDADRVATKPTDNLSAYENVLRGQKLLHKYTRKDYADARRYFEQAISLDPNYARAHAWLAFAELYGWFWDMPPGGLDLAVRAGEAALVLDDHESRSHLALGVAQLFRAEHNKAEYHLLRASELNPNDDLILTENGRYLMYKGEPLAGADLVRQAMRRNPYHPNWYWNILGRCLHTAKLYNEAISAFERISTPQYWNHAYLAACYTELGQSLEAAKHSKAVLAIKPDFTISGFAAALPYRDERVLREFLAGLHRGGLPT